MSENIYIKNVSKSGRHSEEEFRGLRAYKVQRAIKSRDQYIFLNADDVTYLVIKVSL